MFTGIVQGLIKVKSLIRKEEFCTLVLSFPEGKTAGLVPGASVAINGTCLTATEIHGNDAHFDVIASTLRITNLGELDVGSVANFERAARIGDEIGGHQTSGHIHDLAVISAREDFPDNCKLTFEVPDAYRKYLMDKGYIALNGCSLTIAGLTEKGFFVFLIPETLGVTTFGSAKAGDKINLEIDPSTQTIVDTIERYLATRNA
ncbi:riboflavin synthase subunit alpha [Pokkaliibacter sp. MBI-7]|uniref:riboflavin synthase subunit alpha n=1 Tax=Pokkaliibacter sp. MBI-7 TaxID=3040600 RepID=UPI00244CDB4C|nr:riboflavin synthase subunit alpha [Pokkaliibacter sp. MBI-7]MDH2435736.1 riboflavin synthase subunit alpha [Pokkaliibacter sp. MBI-7]